MRTLASEPPENACPDSQKIRLKYGRSAPGLLHHGWIEQDRAAVGEWGVIRRSETLRRQAGIAFAPTGIDREVFAESL
jgi:hypothetical protein